MSVDVRRQYHRSLVQHTPSFSHSVLASVKVESLVLQDLPLPHDVLHLPVQEPGEGGDHPLVASPDVLLLQQSESEVENSNVLIIAEYIKYNPGAKLCFVSQQKIVCY